MRAGTIFLLMTVTCVLAQEKPASSAACEVKGLTVESPIPANVARVQAPTFSSAMDPAYSDVFFRLTNSRHASLIETTILLEFLDAKGNWLVTVPVSYSQHKNPQASPLNLNDPPYLVKILAEPIPGGGSRQLFGLSPIVVSQCPRSVRVSFAKLVFGNGYSYSYSSNHWSTDPVLLNVTSPRTSPEAPLPSYAVAHGNINVSGKLTDVQVLNATGQADVGWLKKEAESWSFAPAREYTKPTAMPVTLIVRFHSSPKGDTSHITRDILTATQPMPRKFSVIDVVPDPNQHSWKLFYASKPL